jgi:hypothetical protein
VSDLIPVTVRQHVYSTVPGRVGNWAYHCKLELPWVPSEGAYICFTRPDGTEYCTELVKNVIISTNAISIDLRNVSTGSPDIIDDLDARGWERLGGPWKGQSAE